MLGLKFILVLALGIPGGFAKVVARFLVPSMEVKSGFDEVGLQQDQMRYGTADGTHWGTHTFGKRYGGDMANGLVTQQLLMIWNSLSLMVH